MEQRSTKPKKNSLSDVFADEKRSHTIELAIKLYNKCIDLDPTEISFYCLRSYCLSEHGSFEASMSDAELVLQKWEDKPEAWFLKEKSLAGLRRYLEAAEAQKTVISLKEEMKDPDMDIDKTIRTSIIRDFHVWTACRDLKVHPTLSHSNNNDEGDHKTSRRESSKSRKSSSKKETDSSSSSRARSSSKDTKTDRKRNRSPSKDNVIQPTTKRIKSPSSTKLGSKVVHSSSLSSRDTGDSPSTSGREIRTRSPQNRDPRLNNNRHPRLHRPNNENEFRIVDSVDSDNLDPSSHDFSTDRQDHLDVHASRRIRTPSPVERPKDGDLYPFANNSEDIIKTNNSSSKRDPNGNRRESPSRTPPLDSRIRRRSRSDAGHAGNNNIRLSSPNNTIPRHNQTRRPRTPSSPRSSPRAMTPPIPRKDLPVNIYRFNGIRIRNIYPQVHAKVIHDLCSNFGKVIDVEVSDKEAVVSFSDCEAPRKAIFSWNNTVVHRVSNFSERLVVRFALGCNQDKFHMRNVRRVECDECHFYRTTGCPDRDCPEKHFPANQGIDLQPWMKGGRI